MDLRERVSEAFSGSLGDLREETPHWRRGGMAYAAACKAVYPSSILGVASSVNGLILGLGVKGFMFLWRIQNVL